MTATNLSSHVCTGSPVWLEEFHATFNWPCIGGQGKGCMELLYYQTWFPVSTLIQKCIDISR